MLFQTVGKESAGAVEYKGKGKYPHLDAAYAQLLLYKEDLGNPPVLVVSDIATYEVHIAFTGYRTRIEKFTNADLANASTRELLRLVFTKPEELRPVESQETLTEKAAERLAQVARFLRTAKAGGFRAHISMIATPNESLKLNSDVIHPWVNGLDITNRPRNVWIIDFGVNLSQEEASLYQAPYKYVLENVKPARDKVRDRLERERWWLHARPAPDLRAAISQLQRYIVTPRVVRHRMFVFVQANTIPDGRLVVVARDDDYFFGVLHSRLHEVWSLATSSRHGVGNDPTYNNSTCFETFPFPWPPGTEDQADPKVRAVAEAARELVRLRDAWLAGGEPALTIGASPADTSAPAADTSAAAAHANVPPADTIAAAAHAIVPPADTIAAAAHAIVAAAHASVAAADTSAPPAHASAPATTMSAPGATHDPARSPASGPQPPVSSLQSPAPSL